MKFSILNKEIVKSDEIKLSDTNRGYLYGDGFFETVKIFNSKLFNFKNHFQRISRSIKLLDLEFNFSIFALENMIMKVIDKNKIKDGSVRVTIYRDSFGKYLPESNKTSFHIVSSIDDKNLFILNNDPLSLDIYNENCKAASDLSNIKSLNSLLYVLASIYANKNNLDDVLIINSNNDIIESTNSNLFIFLDNMIYTPPLSDGCVDGSMRRLIIDILEKKYTVSIQSISEEQVLSSNEVFLTNAISGVKSVGSIGKMNYNRSSISKYLIGSLNSLI